MANQCAHPNSTEDEEEALSLCDLPTNDDNDHGHEQLRRTSESAPGQDDFDFGSWSIGSCVLTQPEMCAADDVFFQGQILPLRHSISSSSESGLGKFGQDMSIKSNGCIMSRSASMDHHRCFSSSRSSSIRSYNSGSSGSGSSSTLTLPAPKGYYRPKLRNQFHSHPSPTPQIRIPQHKKKKNNSSPKSTMWRFFQGGLLRTPEMELKYINARSSTSTSTRNNNTIRSFGSRNSNSSISSSSSINNNAENNNSKKMKLRRSGLFGISCKCSVNAIESTVPLNTVVIVKNISTNKKNGSEKEELLLGNNNKKKENQGKQAMSRHRTFEWLKQLSLQEGAASSSSSRPADQP